MVTTPTASSQSSSPFSQADWQLGYRSLKTEHSYWIDSKEGTVPPELKGTLFRNGPGMLDVSGDPYGHPFDGDGMITSLTFTGERVHFANRFIQTPEFQAEQKAGRILYRGVFGTFKPGGWWANCFDLKFKNPANTSVIFQGGKLLALWEASAPYRLDPATLATLGRETFGGSLSVEQPFTAHPRRDPVTGDLMAFGVRTGLSSTLYSFRINAQGEMVEKTEHSIPGFCFLHDFVWTPHYRIFFQNPMGFNSLPFILGLRSAGMCLQQKLNTPTRILIYTREGQLTTLEAEAGFIFHHVNGYELGEEIIIDSIVYDQYPSLEGGVDYHEVDFNSIPGGKLVRFTLNPSQGTVHKRVLMERTVEFPTVDPNRMGHPYRYVVLGSTHADTGNAPLQALVKVDLQTGSQEVYSVAPRRFMGEPIFVPHPEQDSGDEEQGWQRGWILATVFNAEHNRSELMIFKAQSLSSGPVAVLHLKHPIPYALHGTFTPEIFIS